MSDMTVIPDLAPSARQKFLTRVLPFILAVIGLALLPLLEPSRTAYSLLNAIGINVVFALSYNMLLGQAGLLSFGHAVYFGLGGYAAMHALAAIEEASYGDGGFWAGFPVFGLPLIGFAGGALAGAILGWPSCKRSGVPFAMISLGIAELMAAAGLMFISVFGGEEGVTADRMSGPELFGLSLGPINEVYWFIAFWTVVATIAMFAFTRTPLGRLAQACRDNPQRVQFIGYDAHKIRYLVFILSGGFAGLAGGMAAVNYEIFTPESLGALASGVVLLMAYIGGIQYFWGPILGAAVLTAAQSNLSDYTSGWLLYLGLLFIAIVMWAPAGLAGIITSLLRARGETLVRWLARAACGLVCFLGVIVVVEVLMRRSEGYGEVFEPFGIALPPDSLMTWVLGIGLIAIGAFGLRRLTQD